LLISIAASAISGLSKGVNYTVIHGIDYIYVSFALAFILSWIVNILLGDPNRKSLHSKFNPKIVIVAALLSVVLTTIFSLNSNVTRYLQLNSNSFYPEASRALLYFDGDPSGDVQRCQLVIDKLVSKPSWLGSDQTMLIGLNQRSIWAHGLPFCSIDQNILFDEYYAK
jgi:hypothetical protein